MISKNNEKRGLQAPLPGNPAYPASQSWLTLSYVRPEGKYSPPLLYLPGRRSLAGAEDRGSICDQTRKNFLFSWKDEAEFSSFKGRRSWEEGRRREMALFESCCGQDEPTGSFPPLPAIQHYNSMRKGRSSIQRGSYEITVHSINIRMIHTWHNFGCIRKRNRLADFHPG